jgi:integrase
MVKKRSHGEGSLFKRKDGYWVAQATVQGKHISKYFKSQGEARNWLHETIKQIGDGMSLLAAQTTLEEFLHQWLISYQNSIRPNTFNQYAGLIHNRIIPALGKIKLKDLSTTQVQVFINSEVKRGASPPMIRYIHGVLRRALNFALKWNLIVRNPALGVSRPRIIRNEMKTLSDDQVRSFLSSVRGNRYEALYWLALSTGLRQGELLGLKWSDLEWSTKHLHIRRQVQRQKGKGLVLTEPKSAAGKRLVVLSSHTIGALQTHFNLQIDEKIAAGKRWQENDLIFPSTFGTPLDHSNLSKDFKESLKRAGLPEIRFHDLRHTSASLMLMQGVNPKIVQERLGHSDISLTLNTYSHVMPSMQESAAEKLDELLVPIDVSNEIKKVSEPAPTYSVPDHD